MRPEEMMEGIRHIEDAHVDAGARRCPPKLRSPWGMIASAACLCLVIAGVVFLRGAGLLTPENPSTLPPETTLSTVPPTTAPIETGPSVQEQLEELFSDEGSWYNMALSSLYSTPKDLDLRAFFGRGFPEETAELTDEEWAQLETAGFDRRADTLRLPLSEMNGVLNAYFGITLDDTNFVGMEDMVYLENTGCYYLTRTDTATVQDIKILSMESIGIGYCVAYEVSSPNTDASPRLLVLQRNGSSFRIGSHTQPEMALGVIPEIPIVTKLTEKPDNATLEDLVFTNYELDLSWKSNAYYHPQQLSVRLPAILPISAGALAINEEIRLAFQEQFQSTRTMYYSAEPGRFQEISYQIDYDAWLSSNILSIVIRLSIQNDLYQVKVYSLDITTGQRLTTADLAQQYLQESYAQFVYHSAHELNLYQLEKTGSGISFSDADYNSYRAREHFMLGAELYVADGTLMVTGSIGNPRVFFDLPFAEINTHSWSRTTEDIYRELWGKYLNTNASLSFGDFLGALFYAEPEVFTKMLSLVEKDRITKNIERLVPTTWSTEAERAKFIAICQSLTDISGDDAYKQTAELLLTQAKRSPQATYTMSPITTVRLPVIAPIEPTVPPKDAHVEGSLPVIPIVRKLTQCPKDPTVTDLVFTNYQHSVSWIGKSKKQVTVNATLPALLPISEGAVAINDQIRSVFEDEFRTVRDSYNSGFSVVSRDIDYTASLFGDILSLRILTTHYNEIGEYYHEVSYLLDISTGEQLETADLITREFGISYAEFLYHATGTIYQHYFTYAEEFHHPNSIPEIASQIETDVMTMQNYSLVLSKDGTLLLPAYHAATGDAMQLVYDPNAQCSVPVSSASEAYDWLFNLLNDTSSYPWACLVVNTFFTEPEQFIQQLTAQPDAVQQRITALLMNGIGMDNYEAFKTACADLLNNAGAPMKTTLERLLEALENNPNYVT